MSKLAMVFVALCAVHTITAYGPDPLVAAKLKVQNDIRSINMQISANIRNLGFEIQSIRTKNILALKALILEMEASFNQCVANNLIDAKTIWPLIETLDACKLNQKYENVKAMAMPALNELLGDAGRAIDGCKVVTNPTECATGAAAGITDSSAEITGKALENIANVADDSRRCLVDATNNLENRIKTLSNNWNACKAN